MCARVCVCIRVLSPPVAISTASTIRLGHRRSASAIHAKCVCKNTVVNNKNSSGCHMGGRSKRALQMTMTTSSASGYEHKHTHVLLVPTSSPPSSPDFATTSTLCVCVCVTENSIFPTNSMHLVLFLFHRRVCDCVSARGRYKFAGGRDKRCACSWVSL